jgi:hypothetical protein
MPTAPIVTQRRAVAAEFTILANMLLICWHFRCIRRILPSCMDTANRQQAFPQSAYAGLDFIKAAFCPLEFTATKLGKHPDFAQLRKDMAIAVLEVGDALRYPRQFPFTDPHGHRKTGTQIITAPFGLAPKDFDLFLGLYTYLRRLPEIPSDGRTHLTVDFLARTLGLPATCQKDYLRIRSRIFRFSFVKYTNSAFWNSETKSYDIVNFGFFNIAALSRVTESRRPVTFEWDPSFLRLDDICQALQNFIQESPWDEQRVMRQFRKQIAELFGPDGVLVVEDVVLLKQGQHSVGVHRQFNSEQRKKVNCQILTTIFLVTNEYATPLAFRLYLPRAWQDNPSRLSKCKVPLGKTVMVSKMQVAGELLQEIRSEELPYHKIVAGESYARSEDFRSIIASLDMQMLDSVEPHGRIASPESFLVRVRSLSARLKDHLGLDHFEGRTWRGLHHHLCLVALAHGYELGSEGLK